MEVEQFRVKLARVRAGDAEAAALLVREYEPAIRRYVRVHLTDGRLRRVLDTMDVCQSVLANFFVRAAAGQFDLGEPEQLLRLLASMARNRLLNHARDQQAARRDNRRQAACDALELTQDPGPSPSQFVVCKELLEAVRGRLDSQERDLLEKRMQGKDWAEIAADLGGSAEALRKKLTRALDRAGRTLGIDEVEEEG